MDIAIIGFGAIGRLLYRLLEEHAPSVRVVAVLNRKGDSFGMPLSQPTTLACTVDDLLRHHPTLVVECAGHAALRNHGAHVLQAGTDLLVASVGALADQETESMLRSAAAQGGSTLRISAGALGGLDVLSAARLAGLDSVTYTSRKAVRAWKGTPAEVMVDLDQLTEATVFFEGDARLAALRFPQNANVAAAVALAGIGFENTAVRLIADPQAIGNRHDIAATGAFGDVSVSVLGAALPDNPKTSMLAPYGLLRSIVNLLSPVAVA